MKKIVYLTFNDAASGIFASQVVDVCSCWREKLNVQVRLVSFVSLRNFQSSRRKLKAYDGSAIVLPMFPGVENWKRNGFLLSILFWIINPQIVVCRGPFACMLALRHGNKRRICFDARGAYTAELSEYNVVPHESVKNSIRQIEAQVLDQSHYRLAVSAALVQYWVDEFGYSATSHVVVPCTLNSKSAQTNPVKAQVRRAELGFTDNDIVVVYSGSNAGWQSLDLLEKLMIPVMHKQPEVKLLLLLPSPPKESALMKEFSARIVCKWVAHSEVNNILSACDYGWLVREQSTTNMVASPVKYAEYLFAGLHVIISKGIGDFSELTQKEGVGIVVSGQGDFTLRRLEIGDRERSRNLVAHSLEKGVFLAEYKRFLSV